MANPKRKWSKARTSRHRSAWKLGVPGLVECHSATRRCYATRSVRPAVIWMAKKLSRSMRWPNKVSKTNFKNGSADLFFRNALPFCVFSQTGPFIK